MSNDPFRARQRSENAPQVNTDNVSSNAAELAEAAMPKNTGDELAPNQPPEQSDSAGGKVPGETSGSGQGSHLDGDAGEKNQPAQPAQAAPKKRRKS